MMGKRSKARGVSAINWVGFAYLAAVFLGCTAIILLPFFGLRGFVSIMPWAVAIGAGVAAASCFVLAPCLVRGKKFDPPEGISRVLGEVSEASGRKKAPRLMLVDAPEVNAVAYYSVFGSRVAVTRGFVEKYRSGALTEGDVRAVFAHEVAHLNGRHPLKATFASSWVIAADYMSSGLIVAGSAFSALAVATRKGLYAIVAFACLAFGVVLKVLSKIASIVSFHYQRILEYEADGRGAEVAGRKRMASMLQKVGRLNQTARSPTKLFAPERWTVPTTNRSWLDRLFDTHPPTRSRVGRLMGTTVRRGRRGLGVEGSEAGKLLCPECSKELPDRATFCGTKLRRS